MKQVESVLWNIVEYDEKSLSQDIDTILSQRFDEGDLEKNIKDLHDPYLLAGMTEAVERIKKAQELKERVVIFWDYDVDGVTSTAILTHFLKKIWIEISYRLPHRVKDGYWLKSYFIDELEEKNVKLIITVDCWTKNIKEITYAKSKWIDIIVTDHHAVPDEIPEDAVSLINPKRKDCQYPYKFLCGAWVAFKLVMALAKEYFTEVEYNNYIQETIDIVAVWTVADCMTLTGENRIIVKEWLKQIKKSRSKWLRKMISENIHEDLDADLFWFTIWPRLNAAWRMDTPYKALHLLLNNTHTVDENLAEIEELNEERKVLTKKFFEIAQENVNTEDNLLFFDSKEIGHGIIGIVAWRITQKYFKPSIILKEEEEKYVASCRTPEYFDIIEFLRNYDKDFIAYGGHKQAAGFSVEKKKFASLKKKMLEDINKEDFSKHKNIIFVDKVVELEDIGFRLFEKMNQYKPFGRGNLKPTLMLKDYIYGQVKYLWSWMQHITFPNNYWLKILWFNFWDYFDEIKAKKTISLVFELSEDHWNGNRNLMLKIVDIVL